MTLLLQLAAGWVVLSLVAAAGCSLLFQGANAYAAQATRRPGQPPTGTSGHVAT